ncbi:TonB-dependent receptor [Sphingobacterium sp. UT-1RO-CII-1]|uniref:TonB-dependent receptor n=1 Tax=Sphingobacterium sp. UT-1RO-CII-1 TaxID=2995225 RepID=UPI00227D59C6|nr:TonB-dependent receptor [Sphingobacterium sp. UT-1RO-CII-1]MCY4781502.1 TonB-dependent receptor [Sphingobacterium sp. UT-1RO-CII-1]
MCNLKWALCLFVFLFIFRSHAQQTTLNGQVVSLENRAIAGATVKLVQTQQIALTDSTGRYHFEKITPGSYTIEVNSLGYYSKQQTLRINQNASLNFVLTTNNKALENVNVQGKSIANKVRDLGFNVNVIETKSYANSNVDINQILNRSTGVKIREEGGLGSNYTFSINGLSGNHVKFFIDGIPIEAYGSGMSFNNIPVNIVKRIEVYKGAIPPHLATDALGGAVDIITNKDLGKAIDLSYSVGSFNTHRGAASINYTLPKSGIHMNFNSYYNYSDNNYRMRNNPAAKVFLEVPTEDLTGFDTLSSARRFHDGYKSYMTQLEAGVSNKKWADIFVVGLTYNDNYKEMQTGATQEKVIGHVNETSNSLIPSIRYRKNRLLIDGLSTSLFANFANDKSVVTDTSSWNTYRWNGKPENYAPNKGELGTEKSIRHYSGYNNLAQATLNYQAADQHHINFNYMYNSNYRKSYDEIDPYNHSKEQSNRVNKHIIGLNYGTELFNKRWKSNAFGKYYSFSGNVAAEGETKNNQSKSYLGYGLASSFFITPDLGIKASYEHAYRLPTLVELFGNGTQVQGNPKLEPENSDNYNLGLFLNKQIDPKHHLSINVSSFYRNAKNYIHSTPALDNSSGSGTFRSFYNFGGIKVEGAEFETTYSYSSLLRFTANLSYESAVDRERYVQGTNRPKITYKNRIPDKPWLYGNTNLIVGQDDLIGKNTRLEFNWYMQFINEYSYNWSKLGDKSTNFYIPPQWIQNIGVTYSILNGRYNFSLEGKNITDRIAYDNAKLQKPGRSVSLKFRYNLNFI